jgi:hypothetical protein
VLRSTASTEEKREIEDAWDPDLTPTFEWVSCGSYYYPQFREEKVPLSDVQVPLHGNILVMNDPLFNVKNCCPETWDTIVESFYAFLREARVKQKEEGPGRRTRIDMACVPKSWNNNPPLPWMELLVKLGVNRENHFSKMEMMYRWPSVKGQEAHREFDLLPDGADVWIVFLYLHDAGRSSTSTGFVINSENSKEYNSKMKHVAFEVREGQWILTHANIMHFGIPNYSSSETFNCLIFYYSNIKKYIE